MAYQVASVDGVTDQFKTLGEQFDRIAELQQAIIWFLGHNPWHKSTIDLARGNCRLWITGQLPMHFPVLKVVYRINDENKLVTILLVDQWTVVDPKLQ